LIAAFFFSHFKPSKPVANKHTDLDKFNDSIRLNSDTSCYPLNNHTEYVDDVYDRLSLIDPSVIKLQECKSKKKNVKNPLIVPKQPNSSKKKAKKKQPSKRRASVSLIQPVVRPELTKNFISLDDSLNPYDSQFVSLFDYSSSQYNSHFVSSFDDSLRWSPLGVNDLSSSYVPFSIEYSNLPVNSVDEKRQNKPKFSKKKKIPSKKSHRNKKKTNKTV